MSEWRDVPGFEGELVACSDGRIARLIGFEYSGYEAVSVSSDIEGHPVLTGGLSRSGESLTIASHRIIALTFLGEPPEGKPQVNHKDGVKDHNDVSNLEWCSIAENLAHARRIGLSVRKLHKYTEEQYKEARRLWNSGEWTIDRLVRHMGITRGGLTYMLYGRKTA